MAAKFAGKYDQTGIENAEEFYKALGIPENRIAPLTLPSPLEIVVNGNTLNVKTGSRSQEFTLGVEFNETFSKDYIGKSTTQLEGNKLVTKTIMPEGHTMTRTTELTSDGGIIHSSIDPRSKAILKRTYKKL